MDTAYLGTDESTSAETLRSNWLVAFRNRNGHSPGRRRPASTTPHWRQPLARIRHSGRCQGILGTVLRLRGVDVLGVMGSDREYGEFVVLRLVEPEVSPAIARAASASLSTVTCHKCGLDVSLRHLNGALRRLPADLPNRPKRLEA